MTNPLADPYFVLNAVYSGGKYLKQALAETPCEQKYIARTTRVCYGVLEKDIYLSYIISGNCARRPKSASRLVLKIALYMLEFMRVAPHAVADNAVELLKKLGKAGESGFVNAFLRSYTLPPPPENASERAAVEASAPLWLYKRVKRSYKSEAAEILGAQSAGVCVRFVRNADKYLAREHTDTPFENVYIFGHFARDDGFFAGDYTFQSAGSVAICDIVAPCGELLDACAAPGGKSVLLAGKCGKVTACELHPHRAGLINAYKQRMGADNIDVITADSSVYMPEFCEKFDGVLCDCPCSGTGVICENPDVKLFRKEEDIAALSEIQLKILSNCSRYVKRGGRLYYSTCSVLPEENDSVAHRFLAQNPEFSVAEVTSPLAHRKARYGLQFLPHISLGAGFYIAVFTRK